MKTENIVAEGIIKNYIRCTVGDRVVVEISSYDLTRGRISKRY